MRFSMDSMRSEGSPPGTPRASPNQAAGGYTDYRGSSLFAYAGPFTASAQASPEQASPSTKPPLHSGSQVRAALFQSLPAAVC